MPEILDYIETARFSDCHNTHNVKVAVQQVGSVRRGMHQHFVGVRSASCVREILACTIEPQRADFGDSFEQREFSGKLVVQFLSGDHALAVRQRCCLEAFVHAEGRYASEFAALVYQLQEFVLGGEVLTRG